ncbi:MAG TPA: alternative ribosome rescue aminoacyl-tRNA hydrolase ArfB [Baekduia sp.]|nr:alternative ribosome rescue aminoacyl-tRNA hydrolase ArfB [Baekduia sp.]
MDDDTLQPAKGVSVPIEDVLLRASRSSGPGGQHANVTASRIEAIFYVDSCQALSDAQKRRIIERAGPVVRAIAQDARSQLRNRELALQRLEDKLAVALKCEAPRVKTKPSRAAKRRRVDAKKQRGQTKANRRPPTENG